jgi:transcriptional regulator with XRE-family HTH domain
MATASDRHAGGRPRTRKVSRWGQAVESLAARKGMTRRELADRVGIKPPSLWALLVGKSKPKFETVCRLADVLGVSVQKLRQ